VTTMTNDEKIRVIQLWTHCFKIIPFEGYPKSRYYFAEYSHYTDTFNAPVMLSTGDHQAETNVINDVYHDIKILARSMCGVHQ